MYDDGSGGDDPHSWTRRFESFSSLCIHESQEWRTKKDICIWKDVDGGVATHKKLSLIKFPSKILKLKKNCIFF